MKKILLTAALLFAGITASLADNNERPITLDKLPVAAQTFLKTHFADLTLAYAVEDPKLVGSEYEVIYTDRTEVDFRSNGEWSSVERKYAAVPASIVPVQISDYVAKSNFSNQIIKKIERNSYTWEIELSNGIEIEFDKDFRVIDIDD
ncbi:MAG TPA: PepSY-like domain-containing protein [Candidatus Alistipes intestinigallinarum]|uniref:PepSY-like domain-containing protein n=1 Tax=Candidatus Alistipes intestinigallinarum TaxID=2838440 RepID=A0A9D1Z1T5_9BACT|nr:PepSY-like domain-containing protein [Candidatus Alistipes intestinigallinarum]